MIRKLFSLFVVLSIITSCGNSGKKQGSSNAAENTMASKVEFASLIENPGNYVGKTISVEGKVVHVCTHSGKKLFITGENPDVRLYVQAGEEMPKFSMELLGSEIVVEGTLAQIPGTAMAEREGMQTGEGINKGEIAVKAAGADTCETAKAMASQPVLSDLMMVYNKHSVVK
jgi:hypothetical protein